jgi:hypothetical protein
LEAVALFPARLAATRPAVKCLRFIAFLPIRSSVRMRRVLGLRSPWSGEVALGSKLAQAPGVPPYCPAVKILESMTYGVAIPVKNS